MIYTSCGAQLGVDTTNMSNRIFFDHCSGIVRYMKGDMIFFCLIGRKTVWNGTHKIIFPKVFLLVDPAIITKRHSPHPRSIGVIENGIVVRLIGTPPTPTHYLEIEWASIRRGSDINDSATNRKFILLRFWGIYKDNKDKPYKTKKTINGKHFWLLVVSEGTCEMSAEPIMGIINDSCIQILRRFLSSVIWIQILFDQQLNPANLILIPFDG